jgi:hypothetical protein
MKKQENLEFGIYKAIYERIYKNGNIIEIYDETLKHSPIIWDGNVGTYEEFKKIAKGISHDYLLFVKNEFGKNICVWAISEVDLQESILEISSKFYFTNIKKIHQFETEYGFENLKFKSICNN